MGDTKGPYCIKNREHVVDKIHATFTNFTKHGKQANEGAQHVPLENLLFGLKKYATGATITSSRSDHVIACSSCFAHALVRLYDASLDWMLVHGTLKYEDSFVAVAVFAALFREIGNSTIPRGEERIEARVSELCAKQDEIIEKYRKMAGDIRKTMQDVPRVDANDDKWMMHQIMSQANLYPGPLFSRVRKCSTDCKDCREKIDDAVDWLERDGNQGEPLTNSPLKEDIRNLKDGITGHRTILGGGRPRKYFHITRCEPCFFYSMLKTCGTKRAGKELAGEKDGADALEWGILKQLKFHSDI